MTIHAEFLATLIHIRTKTLYTHRLALVHQLGDFCNIGKISTHHGCHIFCRIMRLEVRRLECHPRITRSVTFVECIRSELLPVFPNLVEHGMWMTVLLTTIIEQFLQFVHLVYLLLAHRLTQRITLPTGKSRKLT